MAAAVLPHNSPLLLTYEKDERGEEATLLSREISSNRVLFRDNGGEPSVDRIGEEPVIHEQSNDDLEDPVPVTSVNDESFQEMTIDAAMDDLLENDNDDEPMQVQTGLPVTELSRELPSERTERVSTEDFGGLSNLGNTCYMASALQMLASLDGFVESLRDEEPSNHDGHERLKLRRTFLDLMRRMADGETAAPYDFKSAMDERSDLFIGFRQQDSHEFLTTLLDLLDEDYKPTLQNSVSSEDDQLEINPSRDSVARDINVREPDETDSAASAAKRPRREEVLPALSQMESPESSSLDASTCRSFSELGVQEIGELIHGTQPSQQPIFNPYSTNSAPSSPNEPRCKLVGGRMNTADVMLTPYTGERAPTHHSHPSACASAADDDENMTVEAAAATSPLGSYFTTEVRVRLTCDSCKYARTHKETFLHLSLEIGPDRSVEDGLRRFFAPEKREIKCEKCFCATATQKTEILKLPKALLLHLKRFIVDVSADYSSITYRKNQSDVQFGETLSLDEHMGVLSEFLAPDCSLPCSSSDDPLYALRSVVNHIGSSASCGHYTADAYRYHPERGVRHWIRFNDSYVSRITPREAIEESRQTAYLVMYELE